LEDGCLDILHFAVCILSAWLAYTRAGLPSPNKYEDMKAAWNHSTQGIPLIEVTVGLENAVGDVHRRDAARLDPLKTRAAVTSSLRPPRWLMSCTAAHASRTCASLIRDPWSKGLNSMVIATKYC
jgi:hypothetical protein